MDRARARARADRTIKENQPPPARGISRDRRGVEPETSMTDKRVAIVTGASRGIGEAIARRLAGDGFHVVAVARGLEKLQAVASSIRESSGSAEAMACDLADPKAVADMIDKVAETHGRLDALVNNAGITKDGLFLR